MLDASWVGEGKGEMGKWGKGKWEMEKGKGIGKRGKEKGGTGIALSHSGHVQMSEQRTTRPQRP